MEACSVSGRIKCNGVPLGQAVPLALKCPNPFASSFAVGGMSPYDLLIIRLQVCWASVGKQILGSFPYSMNASL